MKRGCFLLFIALFILININEAMPVVLDNLKDTTIIKKNLKAGISKYENEKYLEAIIDFDLAIKNDSNNYEIYRYKAKSEFMLKKYKEAIRDYTKVLSLNKLDTLSYKGRADAYRWSESRKEAIQDYTMAIQLAPNDPAIYFGRASCYYGIKDYPKAIDDYSKAINFDNNYATPYFKRGIVFLDYKKYREAINDFNKYLSLGGNDPYGCYFYRGKAYLYLNQTDSAITDFENNKKAFPNNALVHRFLGMAYGVKEDTVNAYMNYERCIKIDPNDASTYYFWANSKIDFGHYAEAVVLLETGLQKLKTEPSFDAYYHLGWAKAGIGDTLGALKAFNKAETIDSNKYELYEIRAVFLGNDLRYKEQVLKDYSTMIRLIGDTDMVNKSLLYELRSFIKFSSADTIGAISDINKAIELEAKEPIYYVVRAVYNFYLTDNKDLMLKDLNKAISFDNENWEAYVWKAATFNRYNDRLQACENLKKGIKNGAKIYVETENYICTGKLPKDGIVPDLFFYLTPKFKNKGLKNNKMKK